MSFALAMFPLETVLFPGARVPLHVFEPRYREMVRDVLAGDRRFGVALIERGSEVGGGDVRSRCATMAVLEHAETFEDGRSLLVARGTERLAVTRWHRDDPYPRADCTVLVDTEETDGTDAPSAALEVAERAVRRCRALLSELGVAGPLGAFADRVELRARTWWLCEQAPLGVFDRQHLLECAGVAERLALVSALCEEQSSDLERVLAQR